MEICVLHQLARKQGFAFRLSHHFSILIRYKPLYRMYSYCIAYRLSAGYEDKSVGCAYVYRPLHFKLYIYISLYLVRG